MIELTYVIWYKQVEVNDMNYNFSSDIKSIREILDLTQEDLAVQIDVQQKTISKNESEEIEPSEKLLKIFYAYAFSKNIRLNKLKEMIWRDELEENEKLLFHGAKNEIIGNIDIYKGRENNDFGQGFYTGESYEQAISFVSGYEHSSVYFLRFDDSNLKCKKYKVDQEWMLTIAYYRGALSEYENHPTVKNIIKKSRNCDYIIAPIADNRMFQIINAFINGELTDEQCKHCLAATNLGMQYIFISEKAANQLKLIERCYIAENEKEYFKNRRYDELKLGDNKVKLAKKQYRGKGLYIDEILK